MAAFSMRHTVIAILIGIAATLGFSLSLTNPSFTDYRDHVLVTYARAEADRLGSLERRAIEQEASALEGHIAAVRYQGHALDPAVVQRRYPVLGTMVMAQDKTGTLTARLYASKRHALERAALSHDTLLYGTLADLSQHTSRTSYGLWSYYSTCKDKLRVTYLAAAHRFFLQTGHDCPSSGA